MALTKEEVLLGQVSTCRNCGAPYGGYYEYPVSRAYSVSYFGVNSPCRYCGLIPCTGCGEPLGLQDDYAYTIWIAGRAVRVCSHCYYAHIIENSELARFQHSRRNP